MAGADPLDLVHVGVLAGQGQAGVTVARVVLAGEQGAANARAASCLVDPDGPTSR